MTIESRELFELCKEVYERTGWNPKGKWFLLLNDHKDTPSYELEDDPIVADYIVDGNVPLYTSDYLLEKLPHTLSDSDGDKYTITVHKVGDSWLANYIFDNVGMYHSYADTPLKALLKLTLKLHEEEL